MQHPCQGKRHISEMQPKKNIPAERWGQSSVPPTGHISHLLPWMSCYCSLGSASDTVAQSSETVPGMTVAREPPLKQARCLLPQLKVQPLGSPSYELKHCHLDGAAAVQWLGPSSSNLTSVSHGRRLAVLLQLKCSATFLPNTGTSEAYFVSLCDCLKLIIQLEVLEEDWGGGQFEDFRHSRTTVQGLFVFKYIYSFPIQRFCWSFCNFLQ